MSAYTDLTRGELEERLKLAEDVCVMIGWTRVHNETAREKAAYELWKRWIHHVGSDFASPQKHRDLDALEREFES